jgi:hypothetical protein
MRTPIVFLVALIALTGSALCAEPFEPWWGQTVSAVNVRQNGEVVETLPRGAFVYVVGAPRPETLEIRRRFEPVSHFEIAALYVTPFTLPPAEEPRVAWKRFYATHGAIYDVLPGSDDRHIETIGKDGRALHFAIADVGGGFLRVPWDEANHCPPVPGAGNALVRYFYGVSGLLGRAWFWWLVFLLLAAFAILADLSDGKIDRSSLLVAYGVALLLGFWHSSLLAQHLERYTVARGSIFPFIANDAGLMPLPSAAWIKPYQLPPWPLLFYLALIAWIPCFVGLHVAALASLPKAFKGLHYLFVRHPLEKHLDGRPLDTVAVLQSVSRPKSLPLRFVSENLTRRLTALRRRVDAETAVLGSAIERERARAADGEEKP